MTQNKRTITKKKTEKASKEIKINKELIEKLLKKDSEKIPVKNQEETKESTKEETQEQEYIYTEEIKPKNKKIAMPLEDTFQIQDKPLNNNLENTLAEIKIDKDNISSSAYHAASSFYGANNNYEIGKDKYSSNQDKYSSDSQITPINQFREADRDEITNPFGEQNLRKVNHNQRTQEDQNHQLGFSQEMNRYEENTGHNPKKKKEERIQTFLN